MFVRREIKSLLSDLEDTDAGTVGGGKEVVRDKSKMQVTRQIETF